MIIKIEYDSKFGWSVEGGEEGLEELEFEQSDCGFITLSRSGHMYVVEAVRDYFTSGNPYTAICYVADNRREGIETFVKEIEWYLEECGDGITRKEIQEALKMLEKYKEYSKEFPRMKQIAKKLISEKPPPPPPPALPPPVYVTFEKCKEQLKKDLKLPQDVLNRTRELIEEYQPHVDEHVKRLIEEQCTRPHIFKDPTEMRVIEYYTSVLELPSYLKPDMIIGACLYLACEEKGVSVSQFQIAKAQYHYDTPALSRTVKQIRVDLGKSKKLKNR